MLTDIPDDKVKDFSDQVVSDPSSYLFASLAEFYCQHGLVAEGIAMCQAGLDAHPDHVEGRLVLARCYLANEEFKPARAETVRVLSQQPENSEARRLLAELDKIENVPELSPAIKVQPAAPPAPTPVAAPAPPPPAPAAAPEPAVVEKPEAAAPPAATTAALRAVDDYHAKVAMPEIPDGIDIKIPLIYDENPEPEIPRWGKR